MMGNVRPFRRRRLTSEEGKAAASQILAMSISERRAKAADLPLDDPEVLLSITSVLLDQCEASPAIVLGEAEFIYRYLERVTVAYPHDLLLLDEREYFLGEAARIAGAVCRHLSRRDEARHWLDLSEGWFYQTGNPVANLARVSYQRLALRTEERQFTEVLQLLPQLIKTFESHEMIEDALKCRFLEGQALIETERLPEAIDLFREVAGQTKDRGNGKLLGWAYVNLLQIHSYRGEAEAAFDVACEATPLLRGMGNRIGLAKLQLGLGFLLRNQGKPREAIEAYRIAQLEFGELSMRADIAALHLIIADLLLESGQDQQAEWEIRAALPVIDEYKLVPEGFAALSLLRESLRRRKIDREALRSLHGYFEQLGA